MKIFSTFESFLPRILWSGLIDKYGIHSSRNPVILLQLFLDSRFHACALKRKHGNDKVASEGDEAVENFLIPH